MVDCDSAPFNALREHLDVSEAPPLRCLDHVQQVRDDALLGVLLQTHDDAVDAVVSVLTAGLARNAALAALQAYTEQLLTTPMGAEKLLRHRKHPDRGVRRWAVTTALDRRLLSPGQAFDLSCTDADQLIRARCAEWMAASSPDIAARLLTVRFVEARLAALQHLPDHDLADDHLRRPCSTGRRVSAHRRSGEAAAGESTRPRSTEPGYSAASHERLPPRSRDSHRSARQWMVPALPASSTAIDQSCARRPCPRSQRWQPPRPSYPWWHRCL